MSATFVGPVPVPPTQTGALRVLITGASRGIGFELVKQYSAAHSGNLIFAAVRSLTGGSTDSLKKLAANSTGGKIRIIELDVADPESIRSSYNSVVKETDFLDILINNAAIIGSGTASDIEHVTNKEFLNVFQTDVAGPLTTIQTYLPLLLKSSAPKVINVSSPLGSNSHAGFMGKPLASYGTSKAALNYLNTAFKIAVPSVLFLSISPGWVATDMGSGGGHNPPTTPSDSVQAIRYYTATKTLKNSGDFLDCMTGKIIPF